MYTFAIIALLGLATVKLVDFLCDAVPVLRPLRSLLTFVLAIGSGVGARLLDVRGLGHHGAEPRRRHRRYLVLRSQVSRCAGGRSSPT